MTIEIISASAGSGKTHRIADLVEAEVKSGRVRAHALVAVTFANRAADELAWRLRQRLLAAGLVDDARALSFARVGTVNAVAGRLVSEFSLDLGLSPQQVVLDADEAGGLFRACLSSVLEDHEAHELEELRQRMPSFDWTRDVTRLADLARANGIDEAGMRSSMARSVDGLLSALGGSTPSGQHRHDLDLVGLSISLAAFTASAAADSTHSTIAALEIVRTARAHLDNRRDLPWSLWNQLASLTAGAEVNELAEPIRSTAERFSRSNELRIDLTAAIERCFDLAIRSLAHYRSEKARNGFVDFVDQEERALEALARPEVRDSLAGTIDLIVVDEFQDSSPLQVALFQQLATLAPRSVWVGDIKQSIYGFRSTDPALMQAAIEQVLQGEQPETLTQSWRSRPELVRVTSAVFAPAFAGHGIANDHVVLTPAHDKDDRTLGTIAERWRINAKNSPDAVAAIAATTRKLLLDGKTNVRDPRTGATRPVQARDIAILCRTNNNCRAVADALAAQGIASTTSRSGLLRAPECRLLVAGLKLFAAPSDTIAAAEIARLTDADPTGASWADTLFTASREEEPFSSHPLVDAVVAYQTAHPALGVVASIDRLRTLLELDERVAAWGSTPQRRANLEAVRQNAARYVAKLGLAASLLGFLEQLRDLEDNDQDFVGTMPDADAIHVITWHGAKGLEWPVVVLFDLDKLDDGSPLGIHVEPRREGFDLDDVLKDRSLRYWPSPLLTQQTTGPFHEAVLATPAGQDAKARARAQELRLLYVAWTRARDRLVLAARADKLGNGILSLLSSNGVPLVREPMLKANWGGRTFDITIRECAAKPPSPQTPQPGLYLPTVAKTARTPAVTTPSSLQETGIEFARVRIGDRHPIPSAGDPRAIGIALHELFACDNVSLDAAARFTTATRLLVAADLAHIIAASLPIAAFDCLYSWATTRWPTGHWHREWPICMCLQSGSEMRGTCDLVIETDLGFALVDHKIILVEHNEAVVQAVAAFGQLRAYAEVVTSALRKPCVGLFVHLPYSGEIVEIGPQTGAT